VISTEEQRLQSILQSNLYHINSDEVLQNFCVLAQSITGCPYVGLSVIINQQVVFKYTLGWQSNPIEVNGSPCLQVYQNKEYFELNSTANQLVDLQKSFPQYNFKFYAGYPIYINENTCFGAFCVLHDTPYQLNEQQNKAFQQLSYTLQAYIQQQENLKISQENNTVLQEELTVRMNLVDEMCLVSETDLQGRITYVNDKHIEVSKYSKEELIGANQNIVRHPDSPKELFENLWKNITQGKTFRAPIKNKAKDGSVYYVDALIAPVMGSNGKPKKYIGIRYDKTAIEKEKQEYAALIKSIDSSHVMCLIDLEGNIVKSNPIFNQKYLDEDVSQSLPNLFSIIHREDGEDLELWKQKVMQGESLNIHYNLLSQKAQKYIFQAVFSPIVDENNKVIGVLFLGQDVTEQTYTLNHYIDSNKKLIKQYSIGQKLSKTGTWEYNLQTKESLWSEEHYRIFNIELNIPSKDLYKLHRTIIFPQDLQKLDALLFQLVNERDTQEMNYEFRITIQNTVKYIKGTAILELDLNGNPLKLSGVAHDITPVKEQENQLAIRNHRLEIAQEVAQLASWEINVQTLEHNWSKQMFVLFNLNPNEKTKLTVLQLKKIMGRYAGLWDKYNEQCIRLQDAYSLEFSARINGEMRYYFLTGKFKLQDTEESATIFGTVQDITYRKKIEFEFANREKWIKSLVGAMDDMVFVLDNNLCFKEIFEQNNKEDLWLNPQDFIGKNLDSIGFPEEALQQIKTCIYNAVDTRETNSVVYQLAFPNGVKWFELKTSIFAPKITEYDIICVVRNITSEQENKLVVIEKNTLLQNLTNQLELVLENSPIAIYECLINQNWTMQFMSAHILEISGYPAEDFIQDAVRSFASIIHPDDLALVEKEVLWAVENNSVYDINYRIICKDGKVKWVWEKGRKFTYKNDASAEEKLVGVILDITEKKQWEEKLKAVSEELLVQKEQAEKANKAKSLFLSNMSHEIRTPLNGVVGFSNLLAQSQLNPTQETYAKTLSESANVLLGIVNDILDFSKIEAEKLELDLEENDIHELISSAIDVVSFGAREKQLELLVNVPLNIPTSCYFDKIRLRQILVNLLSNAIKFTNEGQVEIGIKNIQKNNQNVALQFYVKDTGKGIAPDKLEHIFDSFAQEDISTTRQYGGTGLGLAIANKLLQLMGCKQLKVESKLNEGTIFYFDIDLACEEVNKPHTFDHIGKVLLVDNSLSSNKIAGDLLSSLNINHQITTNLLDALELLQNNSDTFTWVLLDEFSCDATLVKNYMDWIKLQKNIQTVLLVSSLEKNEEIESLMQLPLTQTIYKPISFKVIQTLFNENEHCADCSSASKDGLYLNKKLDVLVVDDNRINLFLAKKIIGELMPNANIVEASNGLEAVEKVIAHHPQLVFMDIQMPVMDGHEATVEIRKLPKGKNIGIIALTANNTHEEKDLCLQSGMNAYLSKPIVLNDLKNTIIQFLSKQS
jgi:PAS domain S-box-containing protein